MISVNKFNFTLWPVGHHVHETLSWLPDNCFVEVPKAEEEGGFCGLSHKTIFLPPNVNFCFFHTTHEFLNWHHCECIKRHGLERMRSEKFQVFEQQTSLLLNSRTDDMHNWMKCLQKIGFFFFSFLKPHIVLGHH